MDGCLETDNTVQVLLLLLEQFKSKLENVAKVSMMQLIFSSPTHDWSSLSKPWIFPERACHYLSIICQSCSVLLKQYLGLIRICFVLRETAKSIGKNRHKVKDLGCLYFSVFSLCDLWLFVEMWWFWQTEILQIINISSNWQPRNVFTPQSRSKDIRVWENPFKTCKVHIFWTGIFQKSKQRKLF